MSGEMEAMRPREALQSSARVILLAYAFVGLEWLFFATKPSFLTISPFEEQLLAFAVGALPFGVVALLMHALVLLVNWWLGDRVRELRRVVPALIIAATALILFDNFTYTVIGFSLAHANWTRILYLLGLAWIVWRRTSAQPEGTLEKGGSRGLGDS